MRQLAALRESFNSLDPSGRSQYYSYKRPALTCMEDICSIIQQIDSTNVEQTGLHHLVVSASCTQKMPGQDKNPGFLDAHNGFPAAVFLVTQKCICEWTKGKKTQPTYVSIQGKCNVVFHHQHDVSILGIYILK